MTFDPEDSFVYFGGALKAIDETGTVIGPMVTFYDGTHKDFVGDYFTKSTYLGARDADGVDVLFHHGITLAKGTEHLSEHIFAPVKAIRDDLQIWGKHVLDIANGYEKKVFDLVKKGKLGWSTGALRHQVKKEKDGEVKRWIVGENSYTPAPCEPCNRIVAVKSLISEDFLKTIYDLESIQLIGEYSFESGEPRNTPNDKPAAKAVTKTPTTSKATSGSEIFTQNLTEQNQTFWRVETAYCNSVRDIVKAAAAADITGVEIDTDALIDQAASAFAEKVGALSKTQVKDWLEGDREHEFYIKSTLLNAVINSGLREGQTFEDRLDTVLAANEKIAADVKAISEMRATKAGAKISKSRRERLRNIIEQLESLMAEVESGSVDDKKSVDTAEPAEIASLAIEFEQIKMRREMVR